MFVAAQFTIGNMRNHSGYLLTDDWIKKTSVYMVEYYSGIKKNKTLTFARKWMKLELIILSEISQTLKDKFRIFPS